MLYDLLPALPTTATPVDYHRIHFDPSHIPAKRIVGLLACQRDPLLRELTSRVVKVAEAQIARTPILNERAKKKQQPAKTAASPGEGTPSSRVNGCSAAGKSEKGGKLWEILLEDTVIFPEGGGQPFDTGTLIVAGASEAGLDVKFVIEGCQRRKLDSVHLVRVSSQAEGLVQSLEGREVVVRVDWERRLDHMSIHTAQHLLSAVLDHYAEGLPTLSWGFAAHPSLEPSYVELPRALTWAEVKDVEERCNEAIQKAVKIWVDVDAQQEGFVKQSAAGVRESSGIPDDYTDGVIRHIVIDGIDRNACCGTQLPNLGLIQLIHILPPSTPSTSSTPSETPTRLQLFAGPRAIKALQNISRQMALAAESISVGRTELVDRVVKMDLSRKDTLAREKGVRLELARLIARITEVEDPHRIVFVKRADTFTHDFDFLTALGTAINGAKLIVLLSSPAGAKMSFVVILSPDYELAKSTSGAIQNAISQLGQGQSKYKGGGAKGRYMGKVEGEWGSEEDQSLLKVVNNLRSHSSLAG